MVDQNNIAIKISNLTKSFGQLVAVNDLSLDICKGEIFGFLGPNGAGKTTTINMISGLLSPTNGSIALFNKYFNKNILKTYIGICPQENIIWPKLTCKEQLIFMGNMYGLSGTLLKKRVGELLNWMALEDRQNTIASKLSGGMKRRLNICLALIHDPKILIFDEPEAGLDPQSRILVRNFIKSLVKEKTILLTTHNMDEADRLSNRVAIIDYGKLLLVDSPANLKKTMGECDLLEIDLSIKDKNKIKDIQNKLSKICDNVLIRDNSLIIKSNNLIELISTITALIKKYGAKINTFTLRENTLEDVFIHLTGRKLRQ
ncbi:ABC transporter ATP-binding protein [bacterium]|nr:ABC transporter ATP-binding protein [bacterium]